MGKHTLAVLLGDRDTRRLYLAMVVVPLVLSIGSAVRGWPMALGLLATPLALVLARRVLGGAEGRELIPVLGRTGLLLLAWSVLTGIGLALSGFVG